MYSVRARAGAALLLDVCASLPDDDFRTWSDVVSRWLGFGEGKIVRLAKLARRRVADASDRIYFSRGAAAEAAQLLREGWTPLAWRSRDG
jgi:hypothetical protein